MNRVKALASENAVVIFVRSTCCMCHTVKRLFSELGVRVVEYQLDLEPNGRDMERALAMLLGPRRDRQPVVPVVFIGGTVVGSTDRVMSLHLGGGLVALLRDAGALWV